MRYFTIGNRIPKDYFITKGVGESDNTVHAGSYHLALKQAGIETANIMTYSSIMPAISREIESPKERVHGEVMECIISAGTANKGERISVGIVYGFLYNKESGERYGGLVCERQENMSISDLKHNLILSIEELYENGFSETYDLKDIKFICETVTPTKKYGTAIAAICFTNFFIPLFGPGDCMDLNMN